jgi:flagellin
MSSVSAVSSYPDYSSYQTIASGGRITKASQGAAELAVQEKTESQTRGLKVGEENLASAKSALNIEEGALSGVTDYLQSIKEQTIKAMNGTMSDEDKQSIQDQIKQYLKGIEDLAKGTNYNEKPLLDGSEKEISVATDASGSEKTITGKDSTLSALGLEDFDVTKEADLGKIDDALAKVTSQRTTAGAESNAVDYAMSYNSHAALELDGFQMDREESNVVEAYQKLKTQQGLDVYQNMLQKKQMEDNEQQKLSMFM